MTQLQRFLALEAALCACEADMSEMPDEVRDSFNMLHRFIITKTERCDDDTQLDAITALANDPSAWGTGSGIVERGHYPEDWCKGT